MIDKKTKIGLSTGLLRELMHNLTERAKITFTLD